MSRRIPQSFINELVARTDLVDLIGTRVTLKRAGSNHKGLCPFHDEKTPSFTVSADKGFYKCFGCGAYGNAIDFVMQYENRDFLDAIEILAEMQNLEIPVERGAEPADDSERLFDVLREADQFYRQKLRESPGAVAYLKTRGIDGATAGRFAIGFAPDGWSALQEQLGSDHQSIDRLITAGLVAANEQGRTYDRFRNRIMFPIRDGRGRVVGFGGRLLEPGEPKYLNSPDTPLFDKSRTLYGLYEARNKPGRPERLIVVEGYIDVIALDQFGLGPAVATMGTAATSDNMRQLTRLSDKVVFCFDGDRAGREAAWRAVESILPFGGGKVTIEFVLLPDGEDPDSFVRTHGAEAFEAELANAIGLSTFMVRHAGHGLNLASADGRSRLITTLQPLLKRLAGGHYRDLVIAELADAIGMARSLVEELVEREPAAKLPPPKAGADHGGQRSAMRSVMTFILHHPGAVAASEPPAGLEQFDAPGAALLRRMLEIAREDPHIRTGEFVERFRQHEEQGWVRRLAAADPMPLENEADAASVLRDSLEKMLARHHRSIQAEALRRRNDGVSPP
jgi:DNA primase